MWYRTNITFSFAGRFHEKINANFNKNLKIIHNLFRRTKKGSHTFWLTLNTHHRKLKTQKRCQSIIKITTKTFWFVQLKWQVGEKEMFFVYKFLMCISVDDHQEFQLERGKKFLHILSICFSNIFSYFAIWHLPVDTVAKQGDLSIMQIIFYHGRTIVSINQDKHPAVI